jgi:ankyrin repeat protein
MIEFLIARGALSTLHTLDAQNHSPLMVAVEQKKTDNVSLLLTKYGFFFFVSMVLFIVHARYKANPDQTADTSALFIAVQEGYVPTTRLLLENGANPSLWHEGMQVTPLHIACSNDHIFVVR